MFVVLVPVPSRTGREEEGRDGREYREKKFEKHFKCFDGGLGRLCGKKLGCSYLLRTRWQKCPLRDPKSKR